MGVKQSIESLNKSTKKGTALTFGLVGVIVALLLIGVMWFALDYKKNLAAAEVFGSAFDKIIEFNELNEISRVEMKDSIIEELDEVISNYKGTSAGERAYYYKGYVMYNAGEYKEAEMVLASFVNKYKKSHLTGKAYYILSYAKYMQQKVDEAIDTLKVFEKDVKDAYYSPLAIYRLGSLYEEKSDKENAKKYYQIIIDEYSESSQKEKAKKRLLLLENDIKL